MDLVFLPRNLSKLVEFTAGEEGRYAMQGVRVLLSPAPGGGRYRLEATNGKFCCVVKGPSQEPSAGKALDKLLEHARGLANGGTEGLIASEDWKKGLAQGDKKQPSVGLSLSDKLLTFVSTTGTYHATPLEGRFPDLRQCLPRCQEGSISFTINPAQLLPLVNLSRALDIERLEVIFYAPHVPVGFTGTNSQGQVLDCLLMPLS